MLNTYLYLKDNVNKVNDFINKFIRNADKKVKDSAQNFASTVSNTDKQKIVQAAMEKSLSKQIHLFSRVSTFYANVFKMVKTIVISTIQAGVRYITFTLKQYKPVE